jgi:hypothetical protein
MFGLCPTGRFGTRQRLVCSGRGHGLVVLVLDTALSLISC